MKKAYILLTAAIFIALMLSSGVTFIESAEVIPDKDMMTKEGEAMIENGNVMVKEGEVRTDEGKLQVKEGELLTERGKAMKEGRMVDKDMRTREADLLIEKGKLLGKLLLKRNG
jgi:hypothetical protein